jgi:hypothetical protein
MLRPRDGGRGRPALGRYKATYIALAERSEVPVQSASIAVYLDTEPSSAVSWCGMSQPHPPYRSSESSTLGLETAQAVKVVKFLAAFSILPTG